MSSKATKKRRSFIGIDVSKKLLEVAVHQSDFHFRCPNDPKNFPLLISELISLRPARILLEATGGLERPLLQALQTVGLPVVIVNPRQVRDFAKALGLLAKTDRLDARVLAHFAASIQPPLRPLKSQEETELDALMGRRTHRASTTTIVALVLLALAAPQATADGPRHGLSAFGDLKHPADFPHFPWVNPDAPRGGRLAMIGTGALSTFAGIMHSRWYDPAKAAKFNSN